MAPVRREHEKMACWDGVALGEGRREEGEGREGGRKGGRERGRSYRKQIKLLPVLTSMVCVFITFLVIIPGARSLIASSTDL